MLAAVVEIVEAEEIGTLIVEADTACELSSALACVGVSTGAEDTVVELGLVVVVVIVVDATGL